MLTPVNFLRSYSGFQYLADFLYTKGFQIEVYAQVPASQMEEVSQLPYPVHSSHIGIFGKVPKLRHLVFKRSIRNALKTCDAVILNTTSPVGYFKECVELKKQFPKKIFIQYCTEYWMPNEKSIYSDKDKNFFLTNANIADIIIDVEPNRAMMRKNHFYINKNIELIPNTLPKNIFKKQQHIFDFEEKYNIKIQSNQKVVLYTGQLSKVSLDEMQTIIENTNENIVLIWFAHGADNLINEARMQVSKSINGGTIYICDPIPRDELISIMYKADAGLIIYSYTHTNNINLKYAAPTKLYEYIASGLPIISYGNPSIKSLVDSYDLGVCSENDNPASLGKAIEKLFDRSDFSQFKEHVKNVFIDELCYEKSAQRALNLILNKLGKDI
jgi:glycosyltransferase involved in cell wall biosynthesis